VTIVLTVIAAVLFALGWLAGKACVAAAWCWAALAVGWDEAWDQALDDHASVRP
jgi:hypothetical protein